MHKKILTAGFLMMLFSGIPSTWGIFRKTVCEEYAFSDTVSASVLHCIVAFFGIGCLIGGFLQDTKGAFFTCLVGTGLLTGGFLTAAFVPKQNAWLFYLGFAVPVGMGCAFLYPAVMSCLQKCNPNQKGLATGIAGLGFGLSGFVLTMFKQITCSLWGIRTTFVCFAAVIAVVCGIGSFCMKCPCKPTPNKGMSPKKILKTKQYWWLFGAVAFVSPTVLLFSPQIVEMVQQRGVAQTLAVWIVSAGAAGNALGRIAVPAVSDKIGRYKTAQYTTLFLAVCSVGFAFETNLWFLMGYVALCFFYAGSSALLPSFCTDIFGTAFSGTNYGLVALGMSVGSFAGAGINLYVENQFINHIIAVFGAVLAFFLYCLLEKDGSDRKN